ncbi:MAG: hypothetical protein ACLR2G_13710 [Phascolarctobacterium faecium]
MIFVKGETHDFCGEILSAFKKMPVAVKPATQGSSIGVEIVKMILILICYGVFTYSREVVVEEFIQGKELTVAIMQDGAWLLHCLLSILYRIPFMIFILNIPKVKLNI